MKEHNTNLALQLVPASSHGQDVDRVVDPILTKLAVAEGPEAERIERYIRTRLLPGKRRVIEEAPTVRQFGEWWTSGELARRYPGQIKVCKDAKSDLARLERYVYPHMGDLLISAVRLEHLETVLRGLLDAGAERPGTAYRLGLLEEAGLNVHKIFWGQTPANHEEAAPVAAE